MYNTMLKVVIFFAMVVGFVGFASPLFAWRYTDLVADTADVSGGADKVTVKKMNLQDTGRTIFLNLNSNKKRPTGWYPNQPPTKVSIWVTSAIKLNQNCSFSFVSFDDGERNSLRYQIDWEDGGEIIQIPDVPMKWATSGEVQNQTRIWTETGLKEFKVWVTDQHGVSSEPTTYRVWVR